MSQLPRIVPAGDRAILVEFKDQEPAATSARVRALDRALAESPLPGQVECVPAVASLLILFASPAPSPQLVFETLAARTAVPRHAPEPRHHEIAVRYGGDDGPDLGEVAHRLGLTEGALVERHASMTYTALMLGFKPGFAYLGPLPPALRLPRRETPRVRVAAGSVGIASTFTGVYPAASAGGWHILGRAAARWFDPRADPPALILAGDVVRFRPAETIPSPETVIPGEGGGEGEPVVEVLEPGLLTSVQDRGRFGHRRFGVGAAGAADVEALESANRAVGNAPGDAVLECTFAGPKLRFLRAAWIAVSGADLGAVLLRHDLGRFTVPPARRVRVRPGNVLVFEGRGAGARSYVAVAGGLAVPSLLGSRSTDLGAGFGGFQGRALRAGDVLGRRNDRPPPDDGPAVPTGWSVSPEVAVVRVFAGPQIDALVPESAEAFWASEYRVTADSDRVGCRLQGSPLRLRGSGEIVPDGVPPGAIQIPPDGQPIVMGADAPTTGGYVKPFVVAGADLPILARLVPGQSRVRFRRME